MKKSILLSLLLFSIHMNLLCQIQKGTYFVGGTIDLNITRSHGYSEDNVKIGRNLTEIELSPDFGYFLTPKLGVGAQISLISHLEKYSTGDKFHENSYVFSPVVRYYLYSGFFSQLNLGMGMKNSNVAKINILKGSIDAGFSLFLNKSVALEPIFSLVYTNESMKNSDYKLNTFIFNFSLRFNCFFNAKNQKT